MNLSGMNLFCWAVILSVGMGLCLAGCHPSIPPENTESMARVDLNLSGSSWTSPGTPPAQLNFDADGQALGFGGCNHFNGRWLADGAQLHFVGLAVTQMMCLGPAAQQEGSFLKALSATQSAHREGSELILQDGKGQALLRLQAVPHDKKA
jgi:heat shock protein HslJ